MATRRPRSTPDDIDIVTEGTIVQPTTRRSTTSIMVALALALTACGSDDASTTSSATDGRAAIDQDRSTVDDEPPQEAPTTDGEPTKIVAGDAPFTELEIIDLRRSGDVVTLDFAIVVTDDADVDDVFAAPQDQVFGREGVVAPDIGAINTAAPISVSGVTVIDTTNRNRHLVLRDTDGRCLCTAFADGSVEAGTRASHQARFPAPPDGVTSLDVEVPRFPAVENVPLRDGGA